MDAKIIFFDIFLVPCWDMDTQSCVHYATNALASVGENAAVGSIFATVLVRWAG